MAVTFPRNVYWAEMFLFSNYLPVKRSCRVIYLNLCNLIVCLNAYVCWNKDGFMTWNRAGEDYQRFLQAPCDHCTEHRIVPISGFL